MEGMLKIIAIRPLKGCLAHIRKCLKEDVFYYFCNDYRIDLGQGVVKRRSTNIAILPEDFFLESPKVNISAIVGKNGDGKSSIVELMIRLINNCSVTNDLAAEEDSLRWVEGVRAELYYTVDNVLYKIEEKDEQEGAVVYEVADLSDQKQAEWPIEYAKRVDVKQNRDSFFFTLVSNYSHYAYNTQDFKLEWTETGKEECDDEKCWLHYIFHKNDGYMAPITLHPFRFEGNIDVNRETDLAKQRLLYIFINADDADKNQLSLRRVNGKDADLLVLSEDECKLQKKAILDFFSAHRETDRFRGVYDQISKTDNQLKKGSDIEYERLVDTVLPYFYEELLDEVLDRGEGFKDFVGKVVGWLKKKHKEALPSYSDIERIWDSLETLTEMYPDMNLQDHIHLAENKEKYKRVWGINATQLARLDTIYRIFLLTGYDPYLMVKDYAKLPKPDKCRLYRVYKIWSILSKYPQYKPFIFNEKQQMRVREASPMLEECYRRLNDDGYSHINRKLRQVDNYVKEGFDGGDIYERLGEWNEEKTQLRVSINKLKEHYGGIVVSLDQLPPAIYKWDVMFKKVGNNVADIEMDSLSSGEKQMLNSTSAIIYHLQNLSATAITHYRNINVILDEMELYYHPEYQRRMVYQILNQINRAGLKDIDAVNIMLVTHSPFILSDVPKNHVLFLEDGSPKYVMQENTFGANIHSLLKNGFFLPNLPMGEFAYEKINELFRKLNEGDICNGEFGELYQQIMLVGEPYLRSQLLKMYKELKGLVD